jgi:hypothetical protein
MSSVISASTTSTTALTLSGDTSGQLEIKTGASPTTAVTIDTNQNVGIGTNTPANYAGYKTLTINGTSTGGEIDLQAAGTQVAFFAASNGSTGFGSTVSTPLIFYTNNSERMRIDSSGNVGIGTTSVTSGWRFESKGGLPALFNADSTANTASYGGVVFYRPTNTTSNGNGFAFRFNNSSSAQAEYGYIGGLIETNTAGSEAGSIVFSPSNAGTRTERMRILSGGSVGINTSSPTNNLTIDTKAFNYTNGIDITNSTDWGYGSSVNFRAITTSGGSLDTVSRVQQFWEATNKFGMGFWTYDSGLTERMRITSGGEVYIAGTTDQGAYNLQCNGTGVWGAGAYVNGSDARIKEDIAPIQSGLDVVEKLNPVTYRYKEEWSKDQSTQTGFIAQELLTALEGEVYVDGVVQQGGEYMSVAYQNIIPILTKAIQELNAKVDAQAVRIAELESK